MPRSGPALARSGVEKGVSGVVTSAPAPRDKNPGYTWTSLLSNDDPAMLSRRHFALHLGAAVCTMALPSFSRAQSTPGERLAILVYGKPLFAAAAAPGATPAHLVGVELNSTAVEYRASSVRNLHGLVAPHGAPDVLWGVGQNSPELLEVYERRDLSTREVQQHAGWRFRGHAIAWGEGALVAAERNGTLGEHGFLLHLSAQGKLLNAYPSGSIGPHDIVDCGDYFAVAHYGDVPSNGPERFAPGALTFQVRRAGVSFLDKKTLQLHRFVQLEDNGAVTHLGVSGKNRVLAMGINDQLRMSPQQQAAFEQANDLRLLEQERREHRIELAYPTCEVDADAGVVRKLAFAPNKMRRGQSFASHPASGLAIATFAGSNTLLLHRRGEPEQMLATPDFGIENPRGCAISPSGDRLVVAGHDKGVSVLDARAGKLLTHIDTPLGAHSHAFWLSA